MFQYRQALVRMRQGDSDRQIAAARIMGRRTAARLRELGTEHHWLDVAGPMPADEAIPNQTRGVRPATPPTANATRCRSRRSQANFCRGLSKDLI